MNIFSAPVMKKICGIALLVLWASFIFSKALTEIAVVTALISWVLWRWAEKKWAPAVSKQFLWLLTALLAWTALTFFWSEAPKQSLRGIQKVGEQVLIFFLLTDVFRDRRSLSMWEKVFLAFCLITVVNGWFQYFSGHDFIRHFALQSSGSGPRVSASFKTYGLFACYLICALPVLAGLGLHFFKNKTPAWRWQSVLAVFLISLSLLYLTRSRGAMLAFLAGALICVIYLRNFKLLFIGLTVVGAVVTFMPKHELIHLDIERKEQSIVERLHLWDRAFNVIKARPLTGTGINTYAVAHQKYDTTQSWRVKNYYAHNGYLQMAAETGLTGLFLFLAFLLIYLLHTLKIFRELRKSGDSEYIYILGGISIALLNFLAMCMADTVMHNPPSVKMFWYLLGIHAAYLRLAKIKLEAAL